MRLRVLLTFCVLAGMPSPGAAIGRTSRLPPWAHGNSQAYQAFLNRPRNGSEDFSGLQPWQQYQRFLETWVPPAPAGTALTGGGVTDVVPTQPPVPAAPVATPGADQAQTQLQPTAAESVPGASGDAPAPPPAQDAPPETRGRDPVRQIRPGDGGAPDAAPPAAGGPGTEMPDSRAPAPVPSLGGGKDAGAEPTEDGFKPVLDRNNARASAKKMQKALKDGHPDEDDGLSPKGEEPQAGQAPGRLDPGNPVTDEDLKLAAANFKFPFQELGLRVAAGPGNRARVVRHDGRPATVAEVERLKARIRQEPEALNQFPGMFSVIPREDFTELKKRHAAAGASDDFRHVELTPGKRDFRWSQSCDRVSGNCNKNAGDSYQKGAFLSPADLARIGKKVLAMAAARRAKGAHGSDFSLSGVIGRLTGRSAPGMEPVAGMDEARGPAGGAAAAPAAARPGGGTFLGDVEAPPRPAPPPPEPRMPVWPWVAVLGLGLVGFAFWSRDRV